MSMNIAFEASREIQVVKTGKIETQKIFFDAWQTPTAVTLSILKAANPIQAYNDWVLGQPDDLCQVENVYNDDDVWCDNPIGTRLWDPRKEQVEMFDAWLQEMEQSGWTVRAVAG